MLGEHVMPDEPSGVWVTIAQIVVNVALTSFLLYGAYLVITGVARWLT